MWKRGFPPCTLCRNVDWCCHYGKQNGVSLKIESRTTISAKSLQARLTLCDPVVCSPPDSSVHGILQTRILEWVVMSSSRGSFQPRNKTFLSYVSCIAGRFFTPSAIRQFSNFNFGCLLKKWKKKRCMHPIFSTVWFTLAKKWKPPAAAAAKSLQSCSTLCDPIDSSPPGSPTPGIVQARTLEWVAISFSNAWKWKVKGK